jgi:dipeptidyl aminopeptidase/acylaminoacyl peptidase
MRCFYTACFIVSFAAAVRAEPPPIEAYAALPFQQMRLSPDGSKVAVIIPVAGRQRLAVFPIHPLGKPISRGTAELEPDWFVWKSNDTLVTSMRFSTREAGVSLEHRRLISVSSDFEVQKNLVPSQMFPQRYQDKAISLLPNDPDNILVEINDFQTAAKGRYPAVYSVKADASQVAKVVPENDYVVSWLADPHGLVRLGYRVVQSDGQFMVRDHEGDTWRTIFHDDLITGTAFKQVAFSATDPKILYVSSQRETGRWAIWEMNTDTGSFTGIKAADDHHSVSPIVRYEQLVGYHVGLEEGPNIYFDAAWQADYVKLGKVLPGRKIQIIDRTEDGTRLLVQSEKDAEPLEYWVLDRSSTPAELKRVAGDYERIDPAQVAPVSYKSFTARDGRLIPVSVTLPIGHAAGPIPFVVLPHGGPNARDLHHFDYLAQFLASRGYGVLQPQFRGSIGYGAEFERAGYGQWGLKMQDDVTDATHWLIDQKMADAQHICIFGASPGYGGYSALMGAIKEPSLYRCSIAVAPFTDLPRLVAGYRNRKFHDLTMPRLGSDRDLLGQASPIDHADQI